MIRCSCFQICHRLRKACWKPCYSTWDLEKYPQTRELKGHLGIVWCAAFRPDNTHIANGGGGDNAINLWEPNTGQLVMKVTGQQATVKAVAFSRDGSKIIAALGKNLIVWDASTLED